MSSTTQEDFNTLETALKLNNVEALKNILQNFDVAATDTDGRNCLALACTSASSADAANVVFKKVEEAGGPNLLKTQLTVSYKNGENCVMFASTNIPSSLDVVVFIFENILRVGGKTLLKDQLRAKTTKLPRNTLQLAHQGWKERHGITTKRASASRDVMRFLAAVLRHCDLFQLQVGNLEDLQERELQQRFGINLFWKPNHELVTEVEILFDLGSVENKVLLDCVALKTAIHRNEHSKIKELLQNNDNDLSKNIFASSYNIILQACSNPKTTTETMKLLFSEIKRIGGGDQYLKELLSKPNDINESCLLSVCLRYADRVGLFLDTIEEIDAEHFLVAQVTKRRQSDGMTCLFALCKFASKYESLSVFVGKIFQSEFLGRRALKDLLNSHPSVLSPECIFSRKFGSDDEKKFLFLIVNLFSITGSFTKFRFSRFNDKTKQTMRNICKIESEEWSRGRSTDPVMGDTIGDIKRTLINLK